MLRLIGLFILIPLAELFIIVEIGKRAGFWTALALVVVPGVLGAAMARSQGVAIFSEVKNDIARGRFPGNSVIDGILVFTGGLLLITPGLITGFIGLTVLIPQVRKFYRHLIIHRLWRLIAARTLKIQIRRQF